MSTVQERHLADQDDADRFAHRGAMLTSQRAHIAQLTAENERLRVRANLMELQRDYARFTLTERDATIDGMHAAIERLNATIKQSQEMAQHTNNAVEDAFGVKPSNEVDENHLALIEAAGYRLMRAEATIERVRALADYWAGFGDRFRTLKEFAVRDLRAALDVPLSSPMCPKHPDHYMPCSKCAGYDCCACDNAVNAADDRRAL